MLREQVSGAVSMVPMLLLVLSLVSVEGNYVNVYYESFTFTCPSGHSISGVGSEHSNNYEDRRFSFDCKIQNLTNCQWHDTRHNYATDFGKVLSFQCPNRSTISGVRSIHNKICKDMRFNFYCCTLEGYANDWDKQLLFQCPNRGVISGVDSFHSNHYEDRRFKFYCCTLEEKEMRDCQFGNFVNSFALFLLVMCCVVFPVSMILTNIRTDVWDLKPAEFSKMSKQP